MIESTLNQSAQWKKKTGQNAYTEPIFADAVDIQVRWEGGLRKVKDRQGNEVISQAKVFCVEIINPADVLVYGGRECEVINYTEHFDLDGEYSHREVYV